LDDGPSRPTPSAKPVRTSSLVFPFAFNRLFRRVVASFGSRRPRVDKVFSKRVFNRADAEQPNRTVSERILVQTLSGTGLHDVIGVPRSRATVRTEPRRFDHGASNTRETTIMKELKKLHRAAAEHFEKAAEHHRNAAEHADEGDHQAAAHQAHLAFAYAARGHEQAVQASKKHVDTHEEEMQEG